MGNHVDLHARVGRTHHRPGRSTGPTATRVERFDISRHGGLVTSANAMPQVSHSKFRQTTLPGREIPSSPASESCNRTGCRVTTAGRLGRLIAGWARPGARPMLGMAVGLFATRGTPETKGRGCAGEARHRSYHCRSGENQMRQQILGLACIATIVMGSTSPSLALPFNGASLSPQQNVSSRLQDVRMFCYNRWNGRFLHWGSCASAYHPRIYCRSNYNGQFLHWGSCY